MPTHFTDRVDGAAGDSVDELPIDPPARRLRIRRGGPRTPLPLLPLIAIAAGVGIAYVSQTAHVTQSTYTATSLAAEQQQLSAQNGQLADELARLESSERIIAAAQQLGMRPAAHWGYVAATRPPLITTSPPPSRLVSGTGSGAWEQLIAALAGAYGGQGGR